VDFRIGDNFPDTGGPEIGEGKKKKENCPRMHTDAHGCTRMEEKANFLFLKSSSFFNPCQSVSVGKFLLFLFLKSIHMVLFDCFNGSPQA
jgi:hypothetical protein